MLLQETLADERDQLYNMQTLLQLPFTLMDCECVQLDQEQQDEIIDSINDVSAQVDEMEDRLNTDTDGITYENPDCAGGDC